MNILILCVGFDLDLCVGFYRAEQGFRGPCGAESVHRGASCRLRETVILVRERIRMTLLDGAN